MNVYDYIVFFSAVLHGLAKAMTDLWAFHQSRNAMYDWAVKSGSIAYYYGEFKKNNGYFWSSDFWHYWEHIKGLSIVLAAISACGSSINPLWFFLLYWLEGRAFVFTYHYWLPDVKRGSFWHFIKDTLNLFS